MDKKILNTPLFIWLLFFISIPFFKYVPSFDIALSSFFYNEEDFILKHTLFASFFYHSIRPILITIVIVTLSIFIYNNVKKKNVFSLGKRKLLYIILVLSFVPGGVVEYGLKQNFERPRPKEVTLFGGKKEFYPAYTFANQHSKSFSSGHAAAATSLIGLSLLFRRKTLFFVTLLYSFGMMVARVGVGGHFASDVLTSFFLVYIANNILYTFIIKGKQ